MRRLKDEEKRRLRLWKDPTLQNFWEYVKLGVRPDIRINSVKSGQDPLSFNKQTIKDRFYTEFKDRFQASTDPVEAPVRTQTEQGRFGEELDRDMTMQELDLIIKELKNGKAIGLDSLPNGIIKLLGPETRAYILSFVNSCIRERVMPADLKKGRVTLIFKNEDRRVPRNYRNIIVHRMFF